MFDLKLSRAMRLLTFPLSTGAVLCLATFSSTEPAAAGFAPVGWWGGDWTCRIDGRPARMRWVPVNNDQVSCDGSECSIVSGASWKGSFSDNGSAWVPLRNARRGNQGGLFFNHADGNQWYLPEPNGRKTDGWTTWQGQRYRLSCWR